jgi:(p)ppGpp synthase/HD superfamily hydrolase
MAMKAPVGALKVKLADNMSNMREGVTSSLKRRYERSMEILDAAIEARS